ncbi:unnamed protein product [Durusdinium trenchii]|uniref:Alpha-protein kinase vwkA (von Willebrand factor A alpha-kinase) (vWF kinase) n=2 Tax=Durusdinium trenchii TaxID=1381693 RepID=A0ABP0NBX1_9DINO
MPTRFGKLDGSIKPTAASTAKPAKLKQEPPVFVGARIDLCASCKHFFQGWCDKSGQFYCERCWNEYDASHQEDGEVYAGKVWHDEILEEDVVSAEGDSDDGKLEEVARKALELKKHHTSGSKDDLLDSSESSDIDSEGDTVAPLQAFGTKKAPNLFKKTSPELTQAHIIVLVDTSGSMRNVDAQSEDGATWVSRMSAVGVSLSAFFQKQCQLASPHKFSLISFNEQSRTHFIGWPAAKAFNQFRHKRSPGFVAAYGTHFLESLTTTRRILKDRKDLPASTHLLIFSDGRPADGVQMLKTVQAMLEEHPGLRVHAIGFGDGLEFEWLQQLTSIGKGSFAPSGRSIAGLHHAFTSVTSTITQMQTVTSQSSKASSFSFAQVPSGQENSAQKTAGSLTARCVTFEPPNQFAWGTDRSTSFTSSRTWFHFNGKHFKHYHHQIAGKPVSIRVQPFMQGGMRLVYCFHDPSMSLHFDQFANSGARMVAKTSRYVNDSHNSFEVASAHAKCSAVAKYYSHVFDHAARYCLGRWLGQSIAKIIFLRCYVYKAEDSTAPAPFMVGERYLPGTFLKYNSNCGFVNMDAPDSEIAQAFSHFTFILSGGQQMVLDLQGVYLDRSQRFRPHLILTDPQVVSMDKSFGPGDLGEKGMQAFFQTHKCGATCRKMGINGYGWKRMRKAAPKATGSESSAQATSAPPTTPDPPSQAACDACSEVPLRKTEAFTPPEASTQRVEPIPKAPAPALSDSAVEAPLVNRPQAVFGAKADGPLSALMARSPAGPGKPDFDSLLQGRRLDTRQSSGMRLRALAAKEGSKPAGKMGTEPPTESGTFDAWCETRLNAAQTTSATSQPLISGKDELIGGNGGRISVQSIASPARGMFPSVHLSGAAEDSMHSSQVSTGTGSARLALPTQARSSGEKADSPQTAIVYGPGGSKFSVTASCRAIVIEAIQSHFSIPEEEQHLLQESSAQPDVDFYRVERKMDPRKLRFTQESISSNFRDGRPIYQLLNDLNQQMIDPLRELEPLEVVWHNGFWRSLSNRRLWALKHCTLAMTGQPLFVRVRVRPPDAQFKAKSTTTNDGVSILIAPRSRSTSPAFNK